MEDMSQNTITRISLKITNFFWFLFLLLGALVPLSLFLAYIGRLPGWMSFNLSVPVNAESLTVASEVSSSAVSIDSAKASIDMAQMALEFRSLFMDFSIYAVAGIGIVLGILFHIRNLLHATVNGAVFIRQNIKRIKMIAALIFIIDPLQWLFINVISEPLFADLSNNITIHFPSMGYWFIGLLVFTLAAVFEKGNEMYQELKLTV
jgi:hypothetical protein